jgi:trehalose 6-phosphate phosphatase
MVTSLLMSRSPDAAAFDAVASDPARSGVFCDFDGTLSCIVERPDLARPVDGAAECLAGLASVFAVVGVISGRSLHDLRSRFSPDGVLLAGSYGRERAAPVETHRPWDEIAAAAEEASASWDGVIVERKGAGVAIHYRLAPGRSLDAHMLGSGLAARFGLETRPGRMVTEITEPGPGKADALATLVREHDLAAFAFAGDDVADAEAFSWARATDQRCVLVGVRSDESPPAIEEQADVVVDGPPQLVALLNDLLERVRRRPD